MLWLPKPLNPESNIAPSSSCPSPLQLKRAMVSLSESGSIRMSMSFIIALEQCRADMKYKKTVREPKSCKAIVDSLDVDTQFKGPMWVYKYNDTKRRMAVDASRNHSEPGLRQVFPWVAFASLRWPAFPLPAMTTTLKRLAWVSAWKRRSSGPASLKSVALWD